MEEERAGVMALAPSVRHSVAQAIARWVVPPGEQEVARRVYRRLAGGRRPGRGGCPELAADLARNAAFRDRHRGERCFVLATGPSIGRQDLSPLREEICIAVSYFYLHPQAGEVDPLYHVDAPAHEGIDFAVVSELLAGMRGVYRRATPFFGHTRYPYSFRNYLQKHPEAAPGKAHYLDYCASPQVTEENCRDPRHWDLTRPLFAPRTVLYSAIQLAAYLGCSEIYLLGCDHDFPADAARRRTSHFYAEDEGVDDSFEWPSTEDLFLALHLRWKQYRLLAGALRERGTTVYNATEGGILDVFPCVSLAEALAARG